MDDFGLRLRASTGLELREGLRPLQLDAVRAAQDGRRSAAQQHAPHTLALRWKGSWMPSWNTADRPIGNY